jgi:hypothetical protein
LGGFFGFRAAMVGPFVGGGALAGGSADAFGDREEFLDGLRPTAGGDCHCGVGGDDGDHESGTGRRRRARLRGREIPDWVTYTSC